MTKQHGEMGDFHLEKPTKGGFLFACKLMDSTTSGDLLSEDRAPTTTWIKPKPETYTNRGNNQRKQPPKKAGCNQTGGLHRDLGMTETSENRSLAHCNG